MTPLEGMALTEIRLTPGRISKGLDILRRMSSLRSIKIQRNNAAEAYAPAEFWRRYDAGEFTTKAGTSPAVAPPVAQDASAGAKEFAGHRYRVFGEVMSWHQAKAKCLAMRGHLAIIRNQQQQEFLFNMVRSAGLDACWLGATDERTEGDWRWVDQTPLAYTNWDQYQPNNKGTGEHYLVMLSKFKGASHGGRWCDQPAFSAQHRPGYICQWDSTNSIGGNTPVSTQSPYGTPPAIAPIDAKQAPANRASAPGESPGGSAGVAPGGSSGAASRVAPAPGESPGAKGTPGAGSTPVVGSTPVAAKAAPPRAAKTPPPAVAPFSPLEARRHQMAWSKYLKTSVEQTNLVGMRLVLIPPGEFLMGSSPADLEKARTLHKGVFGDPPTGWPAGETPAHRVILTRPFRLSATELTVGQFRQFVDETGHVTDAERLGGGKLFDRSGPKHQWVRNPKVTWRWPLKDVLDGFPVNELSTNDMLAYCNWLSKKEKLTPCYEPVEHGPWKIVPAGTGYRLPTEAEWEFACRAGTTTQYWFGDGGTLEEMSRFDCFRALKGPRTQEIVGLRPANPFGLFNMHGNAAEICQDWFDADYYAQSPQVDPQGPASGESRVVRGGYYWDPAAKGRSAFRNSAARDHETKGYGHGGGDAVSVRLVRVVPPEAP